MFGLFKKKPPTVMDALIRVAHLGQKSSPLIVATAMSLFVIKETFA